MSQVVEAQLARQRTWNFSGKTVLITGATRGIGRGLVSAFAAAGAKVIAVARSSEQLAELKREFSVGGTAVETFAADLANIASLQGLLELVEARHIDVLVNNAGVSFPQSAEATTLEAWDTTFAVNVRAAYLLTQAVGKKMKAERWGRIINISSQAALIALPDHLAYCASKGAMEMMSKVFALEWAPYGITVNCIAPTVINTPMAKMAFPTAEAQQYMLSRIPVGRFGEVEEVAALALFLASEETAMMTGDTLKIDGGWTLQ